MARIFTDGAEMGDTKFWDYAPNISAVTVPAPIGGLYSYSGAYAGANKLITALDEFYIRYRLRCSDVSEASTNAHYLGFYHNGTEIGNIKIGTLGCLSAWVGGVETATSSLVFDNDIWYLVEVHFKLADAPNGIFNVYVDGTEIIDFTGDTKPGSDTTINLIHFSTSAYTTVYLDDLALNDTTGGSDNSWCGDGIIAKMYPNENGAHNNWHGSDGDDVNNYLMVDEFPNDGDLTYVYRDGSDSGVQDQYDLSDEDWSNKTILRIYPEARARKTSAAAYTLKLGVLPAGGVDQMSAGRTLPTGYYSRIVGDEYTVNPVDAGAWEQADLDALEFVAEVG